MHNHILIIGGTGMLKSACITLARRCKLLTSIAGTVESLVALDEDIAALENVHQQLVLDWNSPGFLGSISSHMEFPRFHRHFSYAATVLLMRSSTGVKDQLSHVAEDFVQRIPVVGSERS